jgi:hypothetical protein
MSIKRRGGGLEAEKVSVCMLCLVFSQAAAPGQSGEVETKASSAARRAELRATGEHSQVVRRSNHSARGSRRCLVERARGGGRVRSGECRGYSPRLLDPQGWAGGVPTVTEDEKGDRRGRRGEK